MADLRSTAATQAYRTLREEIVEGTLPPGQLISEPETARRLTISRTPLREAIVRLEQAGFLVRLPNGRIAVAPLTVREVEALFAVRMELEGYLTAEAARNWTDEAAAELAQVCREMHVAAEAGLHAVVVRLAESFHAAVHRLADNPIALKLLDALRDLIARYRRLAPHADPLRSRAAAQEHAAILDRLRQRDPDGARRAMATHIQLSQQAIIRIISHMQTRERT